VVLTPPVSPAAGPVCTPGFALSAVSVLVRDLLVSFAMPVIPVSLLTLEGLLTLESGTVELVSVVTLGEPTVGLLAVSAPVTAPLSMDESRGCCCCAEAPEAAPSANRPAAERVMHWERKRMV
jgi:hypothetical protein